MAKTSAPIDSVSQAERGSAKPRKRSVSVAFSEPSSISSEPSVEIERASFPLRPLLIGVGVGAAVTATVFVVRGQKRARQPLLTISPPTLTGTLMKVAMYRLARVLARRAVRSLASQAVRRVVRALPR